MRWCTGEYGETSYQFHNGYNTQVHFWYRFECTDGRVYTGNTFVDSGKETYWADMMKSIPHSWSITKKELQDQSGVWVAF